MGTDGNGMGVRADAYRVRVRGDGYTVAVSGDIHIMAVGISRVNPVIMSAIPIVIRHAYIIVRMPIEPVI